MGRDLGGALSDQEQRGVAVETLDLLLLRIPVAAVDAERILDDLLAGLRGEQLRHAGLEVRALSGVLEAGGPARGATGGLDPGGPVGELELDRLVVGGRPGARLSLPRGAQRAAQRAPGGGGAA